MFKTLSLKYKLALLLVLLPLITLFFYYKLASSLFEKDKIAYVYSNSLSNARSIKAQLDSQFKVIDHYQKLILNGYDSESDKFNKQVELMFSDEKDIVQYSLYETRPPFNKVTTLSKLPENFEVENNEQYFVILNRLDHYYRLVDADKGIYAYYTKKKLDRDQKYYYVETLLNTKKINSLFSSNGELKTYLIDELGNILINGKSISNETLTSLSKFPFFERIQNLSSQEGTLETVSEDLTKYLVSFVKINDGQNIILTFFDKQQSLEAVTALRKKSLLFIVLIIAIATIVGLLSSNSLTYSLQILHEAAQKISNGDYTARVRVKSQDEIGELAGSFNSMASEIDSLLEELKVYNEKLEDLVDERTKDLNYALKMQQAMVDSLDQGFFIFDNNSKILPIYSKAATSHFGDEPKDKRIGELLKLEKTEQNELYEFFDLLFQGMLGFKDAMDLAPRTYINEEGRHISLNYFPLNSDDGKSLEGVVTVTTDQTDEMIALEKAKKQKKQADMILSISGSKEQFGTSLINANGMLKDIEMLLKKESLSTKEVSDLFNAIHTLKGNLSVYHLDDIVNFLHEFETLLAKFLAEPTGKLPFTDKNYKDLLALFHAFFSQYGKKLGFFDFESLHPTREVKEESLKNFHQLLTELELEELQGVYDVEIYFKSVTEILTPFNQIIESTAKTVNKNVKPIKFINTDMRIDYEQYKDIFETFVHVFRNNVDHGIEAPDKRRAAGKEEAGEITISYDFNGQHEISIKDDGAGINPDAIKKKLVDKKIDFPEGATDEDIIQYIFHPGFSTRDQESLISGRGVGMDAVKSEVEKVGGNVTVHSTLGKGTVMKITFI